MQSKFDFTYNKNNNSTLFSTLDSGAESLKLTLAQNYIPLYEKFFTLNAKNAQNLTLNLDRTLMAIQQKNEDNIFTGIIKPLHDKPLQVVPMFFKFAPLLDPIKYLYGKYEAPASLTQDEWEQNLFTLPTYGQDNSHEKMRDVNNLAYVEGFFTYLTSKLLHHHNFMHGLDFYGSFLGLKQNYIVNIYDDIEYLQNSDFFNKYEGQLFHCEDVEGGQQHTRNKKAKISFQEEDSALLLEFEDLSGTTTVPSTDNISTDNISTDNISTDNISTDNISTDNISTNDNDNNLIYETTPLKHFKGTVSTASSCSSRSSNTDNDEDLTEENDLISEANLIGENDLISEANVSEANVSEANLIGDANDDEDGYSDITDESEEEEDGVLLATLNNFPVQVIAMECCENTLDSLLVEHGENMSDEEWGAIVMQILMILITYQKAFGFTHNDLHTNNIMYISTPEKFLYYKVNNQLYKVPTFGRLYKIIDFGRAIYKFRGETMCSDSYHQLNGDAATQYNFEPYFNKDKPRIEANYSFDLCRLGCALFDIIVDDLADVKKITSPIKRIILEWCNDDKGRNVMYKSNGDERYPDFKLYKMIARTVHNHTPEKVLTNPYFTKFIVKKIKAVACMNVDIIPTYV
jgi:hypothetical protein